MEDKLKYFKIAKRLNEERGKELRIRNLHFRGNIGSFSLISLDRETPERGISQLKTEQSGNKALDEQIDIRLSEIKDIKAKMPEKTRPTREKELQAWIINYALNHTNHLLPFGDDIEFITSELAFKQGGEKIVNDILGIDGNDNLVVIELKSDRNKAVLERQVSNFCEAVDKGEGETLIDDIVKLLTGRKRSGTIRRMIVWPDATNSPHEDWNHGITEICYKEKSKGLFFSFRNTSN